MLRIEDPYIYDNTERSELFEAYKNIYFICMFYNT